MDKWRKLETYITSKMQEENIAGAAIAISQNGNLLFQKGFGVRDVDTQEPITPDTIFGIASVTKSFTALAILKLEQEGKLSIDDAVIDHLPNFKIKGISNVEDIKIRHLLSHTTGLAPMTRYENLEQFDKHITYIAKCENDLLGKPGEYFSYCNDAFLLLGAIIEKKTGRLYRRYMTEEILYPLGMHRSTMNVGELPKYSDVSVPYDYSRKKEQLIKAEWPTLGNYEAGGGVRSTVVDLLKYGQVYVGGHEGFPTPDYLSKMWDPQINTSGNTSYGLALQVTPYEGVTLVEHGGGQPGVSSNFGFVPEKGLVVAVLTNVSAVSAADMWLAAVNAALDIPLDTKRYDPPESSATREELESYTGVYESKEGSRALVYLDKGTPYIEIGEDIFECRPSENDQLVIKKSNRPIRFLFKDEPSAWALFLGSRILNRIK